MSNDLLSFTEVLSEYIDNIVVSEVDNMGYEPIQLTPLYWLLKYSNLHREYHKTSHTQPLIKELSFSVWNRFFYGRLSPEEKRALLLDITGDILDVSEDAFRDLTHNEIEEIYFFITKGLRKYQSDIDIDVIKLALVRRDFVQNFPVHSYWKNSVEIYNEETQTYHDLLSDNFHDCDADFANCILQSTEFKDIKFFGQAKFANSFFLNEVQFKDVQFLGGITLPEKYKRVSNHIETKTEVLTFTLEKNPLPETFKEFTDQYLASLTAKDPKEIDGKIYNPAEYEPLYWFLVYDKLYAYYMNAVGGNIEVRHAIDNQHLDTSEAMDSDSQWNEGVENLYENDGAIDTRHSRTTPYLIRGSERESNKSIWNSFRYKHLSDNELLERFPSLDYLGYAFCSEEEIINCFLFIEKAINKSCVNTPKECLDKILEYRNFNTSDANKKNSLEIDIRFESCYLSLTEVFGKNIFSHLWFDNLLFEDVIFEREVSFERTYVAKEKNFYFFIKGCKFFQELSSLFLQYIGNLDISNNLFYRNVHLSGAKFTKETILARNKFQGILDLANSKFEDKLFFEKNTFEKGLYLYSSNFAKEFIFYTNSFDKDAFLDLYKAEFQEKVSFAGTDFSQISYLDLTNTNFEKGFDLNNVHYPKIEHPEVLTNRQADRFYDSYEILRNASKDYPMHEKDLFARGLRLWVYVKNYRDKKKHLSEDEQQKFAQEKVKRSQPLGMVVKLYDEISDCGQDVTKPFLLFLTTIIVLSNLYIFSSLYQKNFLLVGFTLAFLSIYAFSMSRSKNFLSHCLIAVSLAGAMNILTFFGQHYCNFAPLRLAVYDAIPFLSTADNKTYQQTVTDTLLPKDRQYVLRVKQECDYLQREDCVAGTRELDLGETKIKEAYEKRRYAWFPAFRFVGKLFSYLAIFLMILGIRHNTRMKE